MAAQVIDKRALGCQHDGRCDGAVATVFAMGCESGRHIVYIAKCSAHRHFIPDAEAAPEVTMLCPECRETGDQDRTHLIEAIDIRA